MRDAVEVARSAGWHLRQTRGHGYGRAFCRRADRGSAVCKVIINTTPERPENHGKDFRRAVRDCPHHFADQSSDLNHAHRLLDGADKLLNAAEGLIEGEARRHDSQKAWLRAQELLTEAEVNAAEVERVMDLAQQFDEEARRLTHGSWIAGMEVSGADGTATTYTAGAEERVTEASGVAARIPNQEDPKLVALKGRVVTVKGRITQVKLHLSQT
ncbi:hypothetical protein [Actinoplanes derwentensis]|uniref:hypothetical protein n=1 Tax=Actinoplanes derwentensis TaxID=113562 RepID=UPI000B812475|nr:hypothetical protein [Actinoplanes derwentensis]